MAGIQDVAKKAGVSIGTVSRVLNQSGYASEKARKKVEQVQFSDYPTLQITLSIGGYYEKAIVRSLMPLADKMLYSAKEKRNTVKIGKTVMLM